MQLPVNVGKQLAHPDDHISQLLTPVALLARRTADAVEHTVLSEQIHEPLGVQGITFRQVVRAAHERFGVGCHCHLSSGHRSGRIKVHRWDGESRHRIPVIVESVRVMLAWPHRHDGDPAALTQTAGSRAQQRGLSAAGGRRDDRHLHLGGVVQRGDQVWRSISPGRAGPGLAALGQVTTQITGIRWRLLTCPVATLDDGGGVMGERVALVRRGTYRI